MDTAINTASNYDGSLAPSASSTKPAPPWSPPAALSELAEGDADLITELVSLFLDDSTTRLETLRSACGRQEFVAARAQAHSLKGSALQMGAASLASLCAALELCNTPPTDQYDSMLRAIGEEFAVVRSSVGKYLEKTTTESR
jgi:HPt (histidine-containing phosphotransfer) domain-containing protein